MVMSAMLGMQIHSGMGLHVEWSDLHPDQHVISMKVRWFFVDYSVTCNLLTRTPRLDTSKMFATRARSG